MRATEHALLPARPVLERFAAGIWPTEQLGPFRSRPVGLLALPAAAGAAVLAFLLAPRVGDGAAAAAAASVLAAAAALAPYILQQHTERIAASVGRFARGFEGAAIGMAILNHDLVIVRANAALATLLGRPAEEIVGESILRFTHPDDLGRSVEKVDAAIEGDEQVLVKRYLRPDGTVVEATVNTVWVEPKHGAAFFFSQLQNVTEQRRAERQTAAIADLGRLALGVDAVALTREAVRRVRAILDVDVCTVYRHGGGDELEPVAADPPDAAHAGIAVQGSLAGYTLAGHEPVRSNDLLAETRFGMSAVVLARGLRRAIAVPVPERVGVRQVLMVHAAERRRPFSLEDERFVEAVANLLAGAFDQSSTEDELRRQALEDPLTGLANRALLLSELERELRHGRRTESRLCVLMLDVDRFKFVNDTLGHNVGDTLLRQVAARLTEAVRGEDLVARIGGDEFVVVATRTDTDAAIAELGERVVAVFATPFALDERDFVTSASVGIAVAETGYETPDELVRDADAAMYRAKELGGARYEVFDLSLRDRLLERVGVEADLRLAIGRGELELYYQPLLDLGSEDVIGLEALVRWNHPTRGLLLPGEFVPVAEDTGLIAPLGRWVLESACADASSWPEPLHVSINLSAAQIVPALIDEVAALVTRHRLDPERLVFEITESLLLDPRTKPVVAGLRALGVHVALDDFGTGYSSLGSLQRFPMDVVKLDRSLIGALELDSGRAVLHAAVELGRALGMRVVAEGIESAEQLERLRALGCPSGQGFLFARPLRRTEAQRFVTEHAARPAATSRGAAVSYDRRGGA